MNKLCLRVDSLGTLGTDSMLFQFTAHMIPAAGVGEAKGVVVSIAAIGR